MKKAQGKTKVGVGGILLNKENEVLMVRRGKTAPRFPGAWTIPTGMVDAGEDLEEALTREMFEELDIGFTPFAKPCHTGTKAGVNVHYYLGAWRPTDSDRGITLKASPKGIMENDAYKFFSIAEAIRHGELHDFVFVDALKKLINH